MTEWNTPVKYVEAVREVLGTIDVDPCSNEEAQEIIKAEKYYTKDRNGLAEYWYGNVFMNPPYKSKILNTFVDRLLLSVRQREVYSFIVIVYDKTDTHWYHKLLNSSNALCIHYGRIQYDVKKSGNPHGTNIFYMGKNVALFKYVFNKFGRVMFLDKANRWVL